MEFIDAASLDASQVYLPACFPVTESIFSTEFRLPSLTVVMPANSLTGRSLKNHLKLMGKSPDVTRQATLAESAAFDGSFPKSNGAIFGRTFDFKANEICDQFHFNFNRFSILKLIFFVIFIGL